MCAHSEKTGQGPKFSPLTNLVSHTGGKGRLGRVATFLSTEGMSRLTNTLTPTLGGFLFSHLKKSLSNRQCITRLMEKRIQWPKMIKNKDGGWHRSGEV